MVNFFHIEYGWNYPAPEVQRYQFFLDRIEDSITMDLHCTLIGRQYYK